MRKKPAIEESEDESGGFWEEGYFAQPIRTDEMKEFQRIIKIGMMECVMIVLIRQFMAEDEKYRNI